jgi:hypothetical protein
MDPVEVFEKYMKSAQRQNKYKNAELCKFDNKWFISYDDLNFPLEDDLVFKNIKNCIEEREKNPTIFHCFCGHCSSIILGKLHNQLYDTAIKLTPFNIDAPCFFEAKRVVEEPEEFYEKPKPKKEVFIPCFQKLTFGKYKDRMFQDVFEMDRPYCIWCIESEAIMRAKGELPSPNMSLFVSYVKGCICQL